MFCSLIAVMQTKSKFNGLKKTTTILFYLLILWVRNLNRAWLDSLLVHAVLMEVIQSYLADGWASAGVGGGPR